MKNKIRSLVRRALGLESDSLTGMKHCLEGLKKRGFEATVVADVGAARGDWSRLAMTYWPNADYLLFEPLQEHTAGLEQFAREQPRVRIHHAAVGKTAGKATIGVTGDLDGSSLLYAGKENREIDVITLADAVKATGKAAPDFIKIDAQGFEMAVLEGAESLLPKVSLVLVELSFFRLTPEFPLLHEVIAWMAARNFIPYEILNATLRRPLDGALTQCDVLFCRGDHALRADQRWSA